MALTVKLQTLCDDVRVEVGGTLTVVGLMGERLWVPPGEGMIILPRLSFLYVVSGLRGVGRVSCRHALRRADAPVPDDAPAFDPLALDAAPALEEHAHAPDGDEHSFIFVRSPMTVGPPGAFVALFEATCDAGALQARYLFHVERRAA